MKSFLQVPFLPCIGVVEVLPGLAAGRSGHACTILEDSFIVTGGRNQETYTLVEKLDLK
jgi:hypothetical protein